MSKSIALKDFVEVDHVDISDLCYGVHPTMTHTQEDVSGFNSTGSDEYLPGRTTSTVTLDLFGAFGSNETHQVLYPLFRDRSTFYFRWRPDMSNPVSATNPELRGNANIYEYGPEAQRGSVRTFSATLQAADSTGFVYYET